MNGRIRALRAITFLCLTWLGCAGGPAGMGDLLGAATGRGNVVAGLKQALEVGTANAVELTSAVDGYLGNPLIRIPVPESLDTMAKGLRAVGFGSQVDQFEVAMNRAAERAASEAQDVFWQGIRQMSFSDAMGILKGGDTAATEYFDRTTRPTLRERFTPIVDAKMSEVGVVRMFDDITDRYTALPFTQKPSLDLRGYVTERALDGLFTMLGREERKIRTDVAARTTPLLREVFAQQDS